MVGSIGSYIFAIFSKVLMVGSFFDGWKHPNSSFQSVNFAVRLFTIKKIALVDTRP